jgi:hypothetical protein
VAFEIPASTAEHNNYVKHQTTDGSPLWHRERMIEIAGRTRAAVLDTVWTDVPLKRCEELVVRGAELISPRRRFRREPRFLEINSSARGTGLTGAFRLKRRDRCPVRIVWVYHPPS